MPDPVLISTWSFGKRGNDAAWPVLANGGTALDAVEQVARTVEADVEVDSVGLGGLPDADGHVSLDGCIMCSPAQSGSVVAVRSHLHVVSIARQVMVRTPHFMLAGKAADDFADQCGFEQQDLLTDAARQKWQAWRDDPQSMPDRKNYGMSSMRPIDTGSAALFADADAGPIRRTSESDWAHHDTVSVLALDTFGTLAGACSTSGTPYKVPGRVGDSPIIGHGLYVDPQVGGAAATGTGELFMGTCASFLAVEFMRQGRTPIDALVGALERIRSCFDLQEHHQAAMIALTPGGAFASAALRPGYKTSIATKHREEIIEPDAVVIE